MLADGTPPQGLAVVYIDESVAELVAPGQPLDEALRDRLLEVQVADLVGTGIDQLEHRVEPDAIVTSLARFTRWQLERVDGDWALVIARPGMNSNLAWAPELEWDGPSTEARDELDEVLARVHPRLSGLPLLLS